ncbi:MAG: leucyl aminopeptidase family protein [Chloroflexota bacterium]
MSVDINVGQSERAPDDSVLIVPFFEGETAGDLPGASVHDSLPGMLQRGEARATLYQTALIRPEQGKPGMLLVGAEKREEMTPLRLMRVVATGSRLLTGSGYTSLSVADRGVVPAFGFGHAAAEGAVYGTYDAGLLKTHNEESRHLDKLTLVSTRGQQIADGARLGEIMGESRAIARDLVNLPPNEITPSSLAVRASDLAKQYQLGFNVLDQDDMRAKSMGSLLGVAAGSKEPPRLIVLRYGDQSAKHRLAVVGKGLTFDSGGLSLKTAEGMESMKSDMSGAAAVIGGMVAIARFTPKDICVTGYIGSTENMPGGGAMRPGDVLTAMNGETIEVLNTDAEGRLVLADVLSYAVSEHETHIVDFATLTGAAVVALGHAATLTAGKPQSWVENVVAAADTGLERAWPMPLYDEYRRAMDSELADIKNTGGRAAGALNATAFLSDFAKGAEWAHMDIAGTAFLGETKPYAPKGATGVGVGTIAGLAWTMSSS